MLSARLTSGESNSLTPPGYWGSDKSMIHVVEDFISENESQILNCYIRTNTIWAKSQTHENWEDRVHNVNLFSDCEAKNTAQTIIDRVGLKIEEVLNVKLADNQPSIVRWLPGNGQAPHADKQLPDGSPNLYPQNDIASLVYLNDDYEGGDIWFPNQNISIKPNKSSLIFFPGDLNFLHGVTPVKNRVRYTMPSFWKVLKIND